MLLLMKKNIKEVNTGIAIFKSDKLKDSLNKISPQNAQGGEYYLTDVFLFFLIKLRLLN